MVRTVLQLILPRKWRIKRFIRKRLTYPCSFSYKTAWFAIKTESLQDVAAYFSALMGNEKLQQTNWEKGLEATRYGFCFISPPVDGWILVKGAEVKDIVDSSTQSILVQLSQRHQEVQFFGSYRTSGYAAWAKAIDGNLVRAFSMNDSVILLSLGNRTPIEEVILEKRLAEVADDLQFISFYHQHGLECAFEEEDNVMEVAADWSIDPRILHRKIDAGKKPGILV